MAWLLSGGRCPCAHIPPCPPHFTGGGVKIGKMLFKMDGTIDSDQMARIEAALGDVEALKIICNEIAASKASADDMAELKAEVASLRTERDQASASCASADDVSALQAEVAKIVAAQAAPAALTSAEQIMFARCCQQRSINATVLQDGTCSTTVHEGTFRLSTFSTGNQPELLWNANICLRGVTKIDGDFFIDTPYHTVAQSFDLSALQEVTGSLTVGGTQSLRDLRGFESLVRVGRQLSIQAGNHFTSTVGMDNLESVGDLYISPGAPALASVVFPELVNVTSSFTGEYSGGGISLASGVSSITELQLPNLARVGGRGIDISTTSIAKLSLPNLVVSGGTFRIFNNILLTEISCPKLEETGNFRITGNTILSSVDFSSVKTFGREINIYSNGAEVCTAAVARAFQTCKAAGDCNGGENRNSDSCK